MRRLRRYRHEPGLARPSGTCRLPAVHVSELRQILLERKERERLVKTEIIGNEVDFKEYKADIEVSIRYYSVPSYVVYNRLELQKWIWRDGNWFLTDVVPIGEPKPATARSTPAHL